jgi:uncharacterized protein YegL
MSKKKQKTPEIKRSNIVFILDSSGSMEPIREVIVGGFNEQLNVLKARAEDMGDVRVSLVLFGHDPRGETTSGKPNFRGREDVILLLDRVPISEVGPLTLKDYKPFGNTPLYDAITFGLDVNSLLDSSAGNVSNLAIILTDGHENASEHCNANSVASIVTRLKATGRWAFSLIGSNMTLEQAAVINLDDVRTNWQATKQGTQSLYNVMSASMGSYAGARSRGVIGQSTFTMPTEVPSGGSSSSSGSSS